MLKDGFLIGQYHMAKSPVHSLDARSKLLITIIYMVALFVIKEPLDYAVLTGVLIICIFISNIPIRKIVKGMKIAFIFVVLTVVFNIFLTPGEEIWSWGFLKITKEGLLTGFLMGLRIMLLIAFGTILTLTTKPMDLTDGLERLMYPLSKIKVPTSEIAMIMSIALRFIPTILEELDRIMLAQRARGADFSSKNLKSRVKQLLPLIVPLFVSAFRRADELAEAMEAKCYQGGAERTHWNRTFWHWGDSLALALFCLILSYYILKRIGILTLI